MDKNKETKSTAKEAKSNAPLLIIGGVLIAVGLIVWYFLLSPKPTITSTANNTAAAKTPKPASTPIPADAPPGAQPPHISGSPTAQVTIEEFADFQCGSCAAAHPVMNEIKSIYGSKIRFIFRNFPLAIPAHDKADEAALAVEAAGMQSKFWDMQNIMFVNQKGWSTSKSYEEMWKGYAVSIGLDVEKWERDRRGFAARARVNADVDRGKALGITSTPSLFINNVPVTFTELKVANIKPLIDAELQKLAPQASPAANAPAETK